MDFDTLSLANANEWLLLIVFFFFYSPGTRHRTIVAEIENDSTFVKLGAWIVFN
jgi:hypothetical protein